MIELRGIGKTYQMGATSLVALADIDLTIARNEYVALIGPSGSGKSTMMNVLGCLDLPTTGTYTLDGETVAGLSEDQLARVRNRKIGFIFQSYYLMPRTTIADNVAQPLIYRGLAPAVRRDRAHAALARVGLEARILHKPNELSGGQRQRVALARALTTNPDCILLDEPVSALEKVTHLRPMLSLANARSEEELRAWVTRMRKSMAQLTPRFATNRVVREYTERHYLPAAAAYLERRADNGAAGVRIARWQLELRQKWAGLHFGDVTLETRDGQHEFVAHAYLNGLDPDAVRVELYSEGILSGAPVRQEMQRMHRLVAAATGYAYAGRVSAERPASDYTVRLVPHHDAAQVPLEASQILWQR